MTYTNWPRERVNSFLDVTSQRIGLHVKCTNIKKLECMDVYWAMQACYQILVHFIPHLPHQRYKVIDGKHFSYVL